MRRSNLNWYSFTAPELEKLLKVKLTKGLSAASALARSAVYGKLPEAAKDRAEPIVRLFREFGEIISYIPLPLCAFVCILGMIFGEDYGCGITLAVLCAFTACLAAAKSAFPVFTAKITGKNTKDEVKVLRKGTICIVSSDMLVPGDVVFLSDKDVAPCDIRLFECEQMYVMELFSDNEFRKYRPVAKNSAVIMQGDRRLPERMWRNVVFKGSVVSSGRGYGVVIDPDLTINDAMVLLQRPIIEPIDSRVLTSNHVSIPFFRRFLLARASATESESEKLIREGHFFENHRESVCSLISMVQIVAAVFVFSLGVLCGADVFGMFFFACIVMALPSDAVTSVAGDLAYFVGAYKLSLKGISVKSFEGAEKLSCAEVIFCKNKSLYRIKNIIPERVIVGRRTFEASSYFKNELEEIVKCACFCADVKTKEKGGKKSIIGEADEICNLEFAVNTGVCDKNSVFSFFTRKKEIRTPDGVLEGVVVSGEKGEELAIIRGNLSNIAPKCTMFDAGNGKVPIDDEGVVYMENALQSVEADDCHISIAIAVKTLAGSDSSLLSGYTLLGILVYRVEFDDDSAAAVAKCRTIGIDPVLFSPTLNPGVTQSAKRAGILAYRDKAIDSYSLSGINDEEFFKNIDSYRLFGGLSDEQKLAIIYARKKQSDITAVCADSLLDIKCCVEGDVIISLGNAPVALRKISDVHIDREGFSSVTDAIEGCRAILKGASYALRFCLGAMICVIFALVLQFLFFCGASFFDIPGISVASPMPAPVLSVLLFAVVPVTTALSAVVRFDMRNLGQDIPRAFADKLKLGRNSGSIAFAMVVFAFVSLLSVLVSLAVDVDPDSAGLASFITMSVGCMLMAFSSFKARPLSQSEKQTPAFFVILAALSAFCIWLCVSYTPSSFAANFGIFKIGYPTLVCSFVCAAIIPALCEMRKAISGVEQNSSIRIKVKPQKTSVNKAEKTETENQNTVKEKLEVGPQTTGTAVTTRVLQKENDAEKSDKTAFSESENTGDVLKKTGTHSSDSEVEKQKKKSQRLAKKEQKKKLAEQKAAAKLAKQMEKEKQKLEKQRLKDKDEGWE